MLSPCLFSFFSRFTAFLMLSLNGFCLPREVAPKPITLSASYPQVPAPTPCPRPLPDGDLCSFPSSTSYIPKNPLAQLSAYSLASFCSLLIPKTASLDPWALNSWNLGSTGNFVWPELQSRGKAVFLPKYVTPIKYSPGTFIFCLSLLFVNI